MNRSLYLRRIRSIRDQIDRLMFADGAIEFITGSELAALKDKMDLLLGENDDVIAQAQKFLSQPRSFGKKAPELIKLYNETIKKFNEGVKEYSAKYPESTINGADGIKEVLTRFNKQSEKVKDLSKRLFEKSKSDIKSCAIYAFGIGIVLLIISQVIFEAMLKKNADVSKTESMMKSMANKIVSTKSVSTFSSFIDGVRERFKTSMNPLVLIPCFLGWLFASAGLLGMLHPECLVDDVIEEADKQLSKIDGVKGIVYQVYMAILKSLRLVYTMVLFPIANALS